MNNSIQEAVAMEVKTPDPQTNSTGDRLRAILPFAGLIALIVFFAIVTKGKIIQPSSYPLLLDNMFGIIIGASAAVFVYAQGNIDFSISGIACFSALISTFAMQLNIFYGFPIALLVGLIIGIINGVLHYYLNIISFFVTMAMQFILFGVVKALLGARTGIMAPLDILNLDVLAVKLPVMFIIILAGYVFFEFSKTGKRSRAIGARREAARQSGVAVGRVIILTFALSGLMAGLYGFYAVARSGSASGGTGGMFVIDVLEACMLGGITLSGGPSTRYRSVIIGAMIIAILNTGMSFWGLDAFVQQLVKGLLFISVVAISFDRRSNIVVK